MFTSYKTSTLNLDFYEDFLNEEDATELFNTIESDIEWEKKKRSNVSFGDKGIVYEIHWYGKVTKRPVLEWNNLPCLIPIKERLEELTDQAYNVCAIQHYPNGSIGINPHRDREMTEGTTICGVSLGQSRTLTMGRNGKEVDIELNNGSLYVFNPPTNDYWTHCIKKDNTKKPRMSLTFRNYPVKNAYKKS